MRRVRLAVPLELCRQPVEELMGRLCLREAGHVGSAAEVFVDDFEADSYYLEVDNRMYPK